MGKNTRSKGNQGGGKQRPKFVPIPISNQRTPISNPGLRFRRFVRGAKWVGGTVAAGLGFLATLVALFPQPAIDKDDITLGINTPFGSQFAIKNGSPIFDMYEVQSTCYFDKTVVGNLRLDRIWATPPPFTDRLESGTTFDIDCRFAIDPVFSNVSQSDVVLSVNYKWFRRVSRHKQQHFVLGKDSGGKHVWIPKGSGD